MALEKVLRKLGAKKVKEMDEAAKKGMFGQPEKEAGKEKSVKLSKKEQEEMQKSLREGDKKSKSKGEMTAAEEEAMDRLVRKRIREGSAERAENMPKKEKPRTLTKREQEREQKALGLKKGGMVKMMGGGMSGANKGAASMGVKKYAKGGMSTANKGAAGMANCGASMKPAQKAKK
jgi:hypothetical protein